MTPPVLYLDPRALQTDPHNSRTSAGDLSGLVETIREHGLLQPVGVMPHHDTYLVVYGNRRREAAIAAGLDRIPCLVLAEMGEDDVLVRQLLENLQRLDLSDLDKARAFRRALVAEQQAGGKEKALERLARRLGLSERQIQRYLGLLDLAPAVQTLLEAGELGVTQAQHLRALADGERQLAAAALAVQEQLSAAELSRLCRALATNPNIEPAVALARLRQGDEVPDLAAAQRPRTPAHLPPAPPAKQAAAEEEEEYEEEGEEDDGGQAEGAYADPYAAVAKDLGDPATRDGNRVRKFHSLDSFVDEVDRLALCLKEGQLAALLGADPAGSIKLKLAARQARYVAQQLAELAGQQ